MPHPGDIHHCKLCGSKGNGKRATQEGLCEHKEPCEGTPASPHAKWFKGTGEVCKSCKVIEKAAEKRQREQRKRDEKAAKKRSDLAFFKQTNGRKKPKTRH
jgi:hypothetical protein